MINTILFMLRWQFAPFAFGVFGIAFAIYGLANIQDDVADAAISSIGGMYGRPLAWSVLALGIVSVVYAWVKARRMARG